MAGEVNLPLVGGVSKKALGIGGVAAVAVVGLVYLRKRKSGSSAATAATSGSGDPYPPDGTTGNPSDLNSTDPATGMTYGDEQAGYGDSGYQDTSMGPTYGSTGYYDPNTGQWVYGNSGTGQAAATTNQAWAQNAIAYLSNQGTDPTALSIALGAYLAGQPVTSDQVSLIDQAIAAEGYPPQAGPNNYPPGINESGTASQGGTGGSGGGVTGSGGSGSGDGSGGSTPPADSGGPVHAGPISNLQASRVTKTGFTVRWNPADHAARYRVQVTQINGKVVKDAKTTVTSLGVSGLHPGWTYNVGVQALPGGPGNNIHVALPSK